MVVIAVDTSHRVGSVALARDARVLGSERFGAESSHLVELGRTVDRLLSAHGLAIADVDRLAVVVGPGSFTGLRVGMAFVKGLHAGSGAGVVTIGTLSLLALPHLEHHETVCPMIDAYKSEVYGAVFARSPGETAPMSSAEVVVPPCAMAPSRFVERLPDLPGLFVGNGVARYRGVVEPLARGAALADPLDEAPSVSHLALIAPRLDLLTRSQVRTLEPIYIRSHGAKPKRLRPVDPK